MAQDGLFNNLCKYETLKMGWYLAQNDTRNNFVQDPIGYSDFAFQLAARLNFLIEEIKNNKYRPRHLTEIDIPKSGLSVRPGSVLPIEDMIVLHACVLLLAPRLDKKLKSNVYSYRLHKDWQQKIKKRKSLFREADPEFPFLKKQTIRDFDPFEAWYECWSEFEEVSNKVCTEEGYTFLTKTDISAYFENINLSVLEDIIRGFLGTEGKIIHLLFKILKGWTQSTGTGTQIERGIPQGNEISSFLGNIYLIKLDESLDRFCKKNDAKWYRYMDDIKVFSKDSSHARKVVFEINNALRTLHLNIQGSKTEIFSDKELQDELDNKLLTNINEVNISVAKIDKSNSKAITKELNRLKGIRSCFTQKKKYSDIKNFTKKEHQLLRRLMTVLGSYERTHFKKAAMTIIKQLPDIKLLNSSLNYLTKLPIRCHDEVLDFYIELIQKDDFPIPYQTSLVLQSISRIHPSREKVKMVPSFIGQKLLNNSKEWVVIQKALEVIMVYPYRPNYIKSVVEKYLTYKHHLVRRAAVQLLVRCPHEYAKLKIRQIAYSVDPNISGMALYFLRLYEDVGYANKQLGYIAKGGQNAIAFQRNLHKLYALAMVTNEQFLVKLKNYIQSVEKNIKSDRLVWHYQNIIS